MLSGLLTDAGIEHVVCESGPSGGRHVWAALAQPAAPETVMAVARLVKHLCPTLDLSPLANPRTGCVRPPGTPHRAGGRSTVLGGHLSTLLHRTSTEQHLLALLDSLTQLVDEAPAAVSAARRPVPVDAHGHLYLPGAKRPLPASSEEALQTRPGTNDDASTILWRILIGAAAARWRFADVQRLAANAPGMEHVRTERVQANGQRRPRPPRGAHSPIAVLAADWRRAVQHVVSRVGTDPTFDARATAIARHVAQMQARADASPGRWSHRGGPADRRILDALHMLALRAVTANLEADVRRLALLTGIGRTTAAEALHRLAADGWITRTAEADGPHGAHWTIDPQNSIHRVDTEPRTQAVTPPTGVGAATRTGLLATLTRRLREAAHDAFTPAPGLGHQAGNLYARTTTSMTTVELAQATGDTIDNTERILEQLAASGLLRVRGDGWARTRLDRRRAVARDRGVDGTLKDRARRYRAERDLWAWWQAEQAWMNTPRRSDWRRRPGAGQLALISSGPTHPSHPRSRDGRADYRAARAQLRDTRHTRSRPAHRAKVGV